jgi:hypothetical protein
MSRTRISHEKLQAVRAAYKRAGSIGGTWAILHEKEPEMRVSMASIATELKHHKKQWLREFERDTAIEQAKEEAHLKGLKRWEVEIVGGLEKVFRKLRDKILDSRKFNSQDVFSLARAADTIHRIVTGGDIRPDFGRARDFEIFWELLLDDRNVGEYLKNAGIKRKLLMEYQRRRTIAEFAGDSSDRSNRSHRSDND